MTGGDVDEPARLRCADRLLVGGVSTGLRDRRAQRQRRAAEARTARTAARTALDEVIDTATPESTASRDQARDALVRAATRLEQAALAVGADEASVHQVNEQANACLTSALSSPDPEIGTPTATEEHRLQEAAGQLRRVIG